ncbi:MAG: type 2 isopentenyl-diphosphate Delta-isomerase [Planctomycetes bacterium]|nr:type 2 isopentenyl-diphosphate Delta-isomerase [Planctomycetota bacterium]
MESHRDELSNRKDAHIDGVLDLRDQTRFVLQKSPFDLVRLNYQSLPEVDFAKIDTTKDFLGRKLMAPIIVSSMTGGTDRSAKINGCLAKIAQEKRIALSIGSGRIVLKDESVLHSFDVRDLCPDVPLFANIGGVSLNYDITIDDCKRLVSMLRADGLFVHLNPMHEVAQKSGDTNFVHLKDKIAKLADEAEFPVFLKDVGQGMSRETFEWVRGTNLAGVDVAGTGGTNFIDVELLTADHKKRDLLDPFRDVGFTIFESLDAIPRDFGGKLVIGSGGVSTGADVAKVIALGTDLAGIASALLERVNISLDEGLTFVDTIIAQLKIAMFCVGAAELSALDGSRITRV